MEESFAVGKPSAPGFDNIRFAEPEQISCIGEGITEADDGFETSGRRSADSQCGQNEEKCVR